MATHRARQMKGSAGYRPCRSRGVSLVEALMTVLLVTITVAGLLQFIGHVLKCYEMNQAESKETLNRWNTTRSLRLLASDPAETLVPVPGARPLQRFILENRGRKWEVLCAEK